MESITIDDFRPQMVCQVMDGEFGSLGYLVIDRTVGTNPCGGGIRLAPGLSVAEIAQLARVMTLKFGFLNFPHGGAKAGITVADPLVKQHRKGIMAAFGRSLGILVKKNVYFFGEDMGTTLDDINAMQEALGNPLHAAGGESIGYTALTVFETIRQGVVFRGAGFPSSTAAIEGFGKVGAELALMLAHAGAKLIAVSTADGALYNPGGLDVKLLCVLRRAYGSELVLHYPDAQRIGQRELLSLPVEILVPCARTWSVDAENAGSVAARMIVPAANAPFTPEAEKILLRRGVLCLPDFVANCGAVLSSRMSSLGFGPAEIRRTVEGVFAEKVACLLRTAEKGGIPPLELARDVAWKNFERMNGAYSAPPGGAKAESALRRMRRKGRSLVRDRLVYDLYYRGLRGIDRRRQDAFARFSRTLIGGLPGEREAA
ncbi:MAG: Glu/Leu/Phe/Val dehydrogenase [Nitrospirales bacterium]|nr:Glu/Leu/Phe/Val dehydrogenase [Nitrospirales bacterium]